MFYFRNEKLLLENVFSSNKIIPMKISTLSNVLLKELEFKFTIWLALRSRLAFLSEIVSLICFRNASDYVQFESEKRLSENRIGQQQSLHYILKIHF